VGDCEFAQYQYNSGQFALWCNLRFSIGLLGCRKSLEQLGHADAD
jgi:hypothetical protein